MEEAERLEEELFLEAQAREAKKRAEVEEELVAAFRQGLKLGFPSGARSSNEGGHGQAFQAGIDLGRSLQGPGGGAPGYPSSVPVHIRATPTVADFVSVARM